MGELTEYNEEGVGRNKDGMKRYKINYQDQTKNDIDRWVGREFDTKFNGRCVIKGLSHVVIVPNGKGKGEKARNRYDRWYVVEFLKTGFQTISLKRTISNGHVKDMYCPSVFGIGYLGDFEGAPTDMESYPTWRGVMYRMTNELIEKCPTYADVSTCDRWHDFSKFNEDFKQILGYGDMKANKNIKFQLDKDILEHGNREYRLEKCCLVPQKINKFFIAKRSNNTSGYEGVGVSSGVVTAKLRINSENVQLGSFDSCESAYESYHKTKTDTLIDYLSSEFDFIDQRIKDACYIKLQAQYDETIEKNRAKDKLVGQLS